MFGLRPVRALTCVSCRFGKQSACHGAGSANISGYEPYAQDRTEQDATGVLRRTWRLLLHLFVAMVVIPTKKAILCCDARICRVSTL